MAAAVEAALVTKTVLMAALAAAGMALREQRGRAELEIRLIRQTLRMEAHPLKEITAAMDQPVRLDTRVAEVAALEAQGLLLQVRREGMVALVL
jgi:hypothetical protein